MVYKAALDFVALLEPAMRVLSTFSSVQHHPLCTRRLALRCGQQPRVGMMTF